jgi:hypothetical protein
MGWRDGPSTVATYSPISPQRAEMRRAVWSSFETFEEAGSWAACSQSAPHVTHDEEHRPVDIAEGEERHDVRVR